MNPLVIGDLKIKMPVGLAPMAGITDTAFRSICKKFNCGYTFTEVVNAEGVLRKGQRSLNLLETSEEGHPVIAHIYGNDPERLAMTAADIEVMNRFDIIDLNCGCPVRKIVAKGSGAALIRDPEKIGRIVSAMKSAVSMPVTVKTRIGFEDGNMNILEIIRAVEEAGGDAIIIHARFAANKHGGAADWDSLALAKSNSRIPVIGNGSVNCAQDVTGMVNHTNVDGIIIGRAAIGSPWLFDEIHSMLNGRPGRSYGARERRDTVIEHLERLHEVKKIEFKTKKKKVPPEQSAVCQFRPHFYKYFSGYKGFGKIKHEFGSYRTMKQVAEAVDEIL